LHGFLECFSGKFLDDATFTPQYFLFNPFKFIIHQSSYQRRYMVWVLEAPLSVPSFLLSPLKANLPNQLQFSLRDFTSRHALLHRRTDICMYAS
jgi:hypothetical protein